jgi:hypothetical protein
VNYRYGFFILLGTGFLASPAAAQSLPAPTSAETTAAPRPNSNELTSIVTAGSTATQAYVDSYAAKGLPLGGFRLFPTVEVASDYDDNIYLSQIGEQSSFFGRETPQFLLRSDWSRHELDVYAASSFYQYMDYGSQDHTDWNAGGDGRLDIYQGLSLTGNGSYTEEHLANSSPDQTITVKSPTEFSIAQGGGTLSYDPYHFGFNLGGTFSRYVYDPSKLVGGGLSDNSDRNEDLYTAFAKESYELSPGYAVFSQTNVNMSEFDEKFDRSDLDRANEGFSENLGVDMLVTNLIRGQAFIGYLNQDFKAPLKSVAGINFGANVDWFLSTLWTLHLIASRNLSDTVIVNASAEDDRQVQVSADYRVTSFITINAAVTYLDAAFDGAGRDDRYLTGRIQSLYHLNPWLGVELSDTFQNRTSSVVGQNFNDNIVTLSLQFQE